MNKMTSRQIDKLFDCLAHDLYDKFIENVIIVYAELFPEKCTYETFNRGYYNMIRERLQFEFGALYGYAKGEKNIKKRFKKSGAKGTTSK